MPPVALSQVTQTLNGAAAVGVGPSGRKRARLNSLQPLESFEEDAAPATMSPMPIAAPSAMCDSDSSSAGSEASFLSGVESVATVAVVRRALLMHMDDTGTEAILASGEFRAADGVFAVDDVNPAHSDFDIGGARLGLMQGGMLSLDDIALAHVHLHWDGDDGGHPWTSKKQTTAAAVSTPVSHDAADSSSTLAEDLKLSSL